MPVAHEENTTVQTITLCRDPGKHTQPHVLAMVQCTPKTARYSRCRTTSIIRDCGLEAFRKWQREPGASE
eukprot:8031341-Alexandrium_andersonii.AAC.1